MGFPDTFKIIVSDTQAYRQFGNSVIVPVIEAVASSLTKCLKENRTKLPSHRVTQLSAFV
jgi:DNA (cytosine-5)-methyltransferase 1